MNGTKYEDNLGKYVGNNLMAEAYTQGVNNKTYFTQSEKNKIIKYVELQRGIINAIIISVYKNWKDGKSNYARPKYEGFDQRFYCEVRIGLNSQVLPSVAIGDNINKLFYDWDYYMENNFGWFNPYNPKGLNPYNPEYR